MMKSLTQSYMKMWASIGTRWLPFADVASEELSLGRMLRLSLFQVTVGMSLVLLNGTLNRIMIVEMHTSASLVALLVSLPLLFAPFRALLGHQSDHHRSALGWRRVPYLWFGTLLQFGGLSIMPFALILLSGESNGPIWISEVGAALAFLLIGAGMHTVQTAGLALATDLAPEEKRPRVVCLLYVMLLLGMVISSLVFGVLLTDYQPIKLIKVLQGGALLTLVLNGVALWKQEARSETRDQGEERPNFNNSWRQWRRQQGVTRSLWAVGLGAAAFSMQDILLEPYGAEVLGLSVSATTTLTAMTAVGTLVAFSVAASLLGRGSDPWRLAAMGALNGLFAFTLVVLSGAFGSPFLFRLGVIGIGFGSGLFSLGSLSAFMKLKDGSSSGLALGAWGAVQATCAGLAMALGAGLKDLIVFWGQEGALGALLQSPAAAYGVVYQLEIVLLFAVLVAVGPLVARVRSAPKESSDGFGLAEFPG
jgi:BCD family chlorophyll transporter-like MFS transporter